MEKYTCNIHSHNVCTSLASMLLWLCSLNGIQALATALARFRLWLSDFAAISK